MNLLHFSTVSLALRRALGGLLGLSAAALSLSSYAPAPPPAKPFLLVIDPGHGGNDPGALGKHSREKDLALGISLQLAELLRKDGRNYQVVLTREKDQFVGLMERAQMANQKKADLFISLHINANDSHEPFGTSTYAVGVHKNDAQLQFMMRENASILLEKDYKDKYEGFDPKSPDSYIIFKLRQHGFLKQSLELAKHIEHEFAHHAKRNSRGVKQAGFMVLWQTTMPAVLVEAGFITNAQEEKFLQSNEGQEYLASAVHRAVGKYYDAVK